MRRNLSFWGPFGLLVVLWPATGRAADSDIRLNSIGYLPDRAKVASILTEGTEFSVRDWHDDTEVLTAALSEPVRDRTGDMVRFADFSEITRAGIYYLEVPGTGRSVAFPIADDAYDGPFVTAMLGFYGWRSGVDVSLTHKGTTFAHAAGHLQDGFLDYLGQPGEWKDGVGGWYDAGDYGKYVVTAAQSVGTMLTAWEHFPAALEQITLPIPEADDGLPDYLDEIRWELEWLLKMPYSETDGRVSHKLTATQFAEFIQPTDDDSVRYFTPYGTAATADFVAAVAQAARVYQPYDSELADRCLAAAELSYAYLQANPENVPANLTDFRTGSYQTTDPDDRMWAAAEMWETTGATAALTDFEDRVRARGFGDDLVRADFDWPDLANLGMFTYVLSTRSRRDPDLVNEITSEVIDVANILTSNSVDTGYGRSLTGWYWGSNGSVARTCMVLQVARQLTGNDEYLDACSAQIAHLYGRNHYGRSQVTGEGIAPACSPHHRPSGSDTERRPYPGLLVGGGESSTDWRDEQASYTTNEVAINWNAALVYALAGFIEGAGADVSVAEDWMDERYTCPIQPTVRDLFNPDTSGPPSLIDDLEDGDLQIIETEGRRGSWLEFDDGTGEHSGALVESPGRDGTGLALHISGSDFTSWGGGVALRLNEQDGTLSAYDASRYTGITFWARMGEESGSRFFVMVPDRNTQPEGGVCSSCYDHFHAQLSITSEWRQYTLSWNELQQQGFGDEETNINRSQLYAIQFQWDDGQTFDLWLDDVAFTTAGSEVGAGGASGAAGGGGVEEPAPDLRSLRLRGGGCDCSLDSTGRGAWRGIALLLLGGALLRARRKREKPGRPV